MRYFIRFAYNGKNYHGWQIQPNASSVQETLGKALTVLLGQSIEIMGAGRTDSGVHAREMYAHFDMEHPMEGDLWVHKLNNYLPKDIALFEIIPVHDSAHARFDATRRTYEYHMHTYKDVFENENSWYYHKTLDMDAMNAAAQLLFQHTDFQCFSKVNTDVNTFNCTIFEARWERQDNKMVFTISADRFLRNMVRAIVGTLVNVGLHKITLEDFNTIIERKNRNNAGFSVPAHGLYLTKIVYPYLN